MEFPLFSDLNCFVLRPGGGKEGGAFGLKWNISLLSQKLEHGSKERV